MFADLKVKSTARAELVAVKVAVTGAYVPGANAGMFTVAFVALTTVNDCNPDPAFTWSTVTEFGPLATPKAAIPPGNKSPSVTVVIGVQPCCVVAPIEMLVTLLDWSTVAVFTFLDDHRNGTS